MWSLPQCPPTQLPEPGRLTLTINPALQINAQTNTLTKNHSTTGAPMHIILKFVLILACMLAAIAARIAYVRSEPTIPRGAFASDRPLNIAHRGGALEAPENTIHAFKHAVEAGADAIEMDVWMTKDGHLVAIHDETVDRTTDGTGKVSEMTLEQIRSLDAAWNWNPQNLAEPPLRGQGIRIPTMHEVFEQFQEIPLIIELKTKAPNAVHELGLLIRKYNAADRVIAASFNQRTIRAMRRQFPEILTSGGEAEIRNFYILHLIGLHRLLRPAAHSFQLPEYRGRTHLLSRRMLRAMRHSGIDVHVWTIEDPHDMQRMIDLGVDGIITNRPFELNRLLNKRQGNRP